MAVELVRASSRSRWRAVAPLRIGAGGLPVNLPPVPGFGSLPIPATPIPVPDLSVPDFNAITAQTASGYIQPAAAGYWQAIQNQFNLEGASQGLQQKAQQGFADAFNSYTSTIDQSPQGLIDGAQAATGLVLNDRTIVGAVQNVQGLIQGVETGNPAEVVQAFTGCMIAAMAAAGTLTAGVGAAIAIGAAALDEVISLFTPKVAATVCGFGIIGAAPTWYWNCAWSFAEQNTAGPGSPKWRKFPVKGNAADAWWYAFPPCTHDALGLPSSMCDPLTAAWNTQWTSSDGVQAWWGCVPPGGVTLPNQVLGWGRPIDAAFPQFKQLEYDSQYPPTNAGFAAFVNGYFGAWQAAQEYNFNGVTAPSYSASQRGQDDIACLQKFWQMWNFAHSPSSTVTVQPSAHGFGDLLGPLAPAPGNGHTTYVEMLVYEAARTSFNEMLAGGTTMTVNTGPPLQAAIGQAPVVTAPSTTPASPGTTAAKIGLVGGGLALGTVALWAASQKISYLEAWDRLYGKVKAVLG